MLLHDIERLKKEKNAVILAHYYVSEDVQQIADYVGDSYFLSKKVAESKADIIVFCGVRFMGESAKILNPGKKVLMPDFTADCPMAHMATVADILKIKNSFDDLAVVCYINSTAEIKMHSDVSVTSANAVAIVKNLPEKNIYFIPDSNLARYVAEQVPEKNIIMGDGYCPIHHQISVGNLGYIKEAHPQALFLAHPECRMDVLKEADYVGSTAGMIDYVNASDGEEFIIGTEIGIFYELKKNNPDKRFYPVSGGQVCSDMKLVTLEKVVSVLIHENNEVQMSDDVCGKALKPLERMLVLGN